MSVKALALTESGELELHRSAHLHTLSQSGGFHNLETPECRFQPEFSLKAVGVLCEEGMCVVCVWFVRGGVGVGLCV